MDIVLELSIINAKVAFNKHPSLSQAVGDPEFLKHIETIVRIARTYDEYLDNANSFCATFDKTVHQMHNLLCYKVYEDIKAKHRALNVTVSGDVAIRKANRLQDKDMINELFKRGLVSGFDDAMTNARISFRFQWEEDEVKEAAIREVMSEL